MLQQGYDRFFNELRALAERTASAGRAACSESTRFCTTRWKSEVLAPAEEYLKANEEDIVGSNAVNQRMAGWVVRGLLLLGICGPLVGAGCGIRHCPRIQPRDRAAQPADPGRGRQIERDRGADHLLLSGRAGGDRDRAAQNCPSDRRRARTIGDKPTRGAAGRAVGRGRPDGGRDRPRTAQSADGHEDPGAGRRGRDPARPGRSRPDGAGRRNHAAGAIDRDIPRLCPPAAARARDPSTCGR